MTDTKRFEENEQRLKQVANQFAHSTFRACTVYTADILKSGLETIRRAINERSLSEADLRTLDFMGVACEFSLGSTEPNPELVRYLVYSGIVSSGYKPPERNSPTTTKRKNNFSKKFLVAFFPPRGEPRSSPSATPDP